MFTYTDVTGKELEARLDDCYITVNKNTIPGEPRSPFVTSGVRIGTAAVTTRGLNEEDMDKIAEYITLVLNDYENSKEKVSIEGCFGSYLWCTLSFGCCIGDYQTW